MKADGKRRFWKTTICGALVGVLLTGCGKKEEVILDSKSPIVVTVWHSYNTNAKAVFDDMVQEFNETVGMERGIVIDVHGYGEADALDDALYNSVNQMIGSEPLPHIFAAYPDSAYRIDTEMPLVEMGSYFKEEEMEKYRTEFLDEGIWKENKTSKMVPVSKSTELLYLNKTDWDRFAKEVGISDDAISSWEGLVEAAEKYYDWSGGKAMLGFNKYSDFASLTAAQLGAKPYDIMPDGSFQFEYPMDIAKKVWNICYVPHINGWFKSGKYNQDGIKSGNLIAYIGSSAGAGYFSKEVIIDEKKSYPIECEIYTYPTFQGAPLFMSQRGANMCIISSDKEHEYAAAEFLKWFTDVEQNMKFAVSTGYLPVKKEAIEMIDGTFGPKMEGINNEAVEKSFKTAAEAMSKETFYTRAIFDGSYEQNNLFNNSLFSKIDKDLQGIQIRIDNGEAKQAVYDELLKEENFISWYEELMHEISNS